MVLHGGQVLVAPAEVGREAAGGDAVGAVEGLLEADGTDALLAHVVCTPGSSAPMRLSAKAYFRAGPNAMVRADEQGVTVR